jgi:hypothetical protein
LFTCEWVIVDFRIPLLIIADGFTSRALIGLHRPLSDLKFDPMEALSACARTPPPDLPASELVNVHTVRVLRSIEAQVQLLALPTKTFSHTPFTTCMINEGTLALLSACRILLTGKDLEVARGQIRMTIGCLQALAQLWPRIAMSLWEIKTIARHVLCLDAVPGGAIHDQSAQADGYHNAVSSQPLWPSDTVDWFRDNNQPDLEQILECGTFANVNTMEADDIFADDLGAI